MIVKRAIVTLTELKMADIVLIAKLSAYGFDNLSLKFLLLWSKTKNKNKMVLLCGKIFISGVPQGSILSPILFNILLIVGYVHNSIFFIFESVTVVLFYCNFCFFYL